MFAPWKMDQRLFADADNLDLPLHSTKNKTKSKHITKEELNNIIKVCFKLATLTYFLVGQ